MEIIIPANRIEGDINSQIIVDNEITKVSIKNYNVSKKSESEESLIYSRSATNVFEDFRYKYKEKSFLGISYHLQHERVEAYYTSGVATISTSGYINNINEYSYVISGTKKTGRFVGDANGSMTVLYDKTLWNTKNESTLINYVGNIKKTDITNGKVYIPNSDIITIPDKSFINIDNIGVEGENIIIDISFSILTRVVSYIDNAGFTIDPKNNYTEIVADTFTIKLNYNEILASSTEDISKTYGNGTKTLTYQTNELFQLKNTYNDGEKEVPIGEFVANQVIAMYKNGRKTATMTALTDNLIVSDNKLKDGHYGVRGRLERQIYKVGDNVIPYKIDKNLKELPNSEYLGFPQSFKVAENEVKYDGKLTQTLKTQENTYFNINYDENLLDVYRNGILVGSGDRIFREEELSIQPAIPYNIDYVVILEVNGKPTRLDQDVEDTTKYSTIATKVNGFISLDLTSKGFNVISSEEIEEYVYMPEYSQNLGFAIGYDKPLTNFIESALHRVSITTITESKLADFFPEAYPPYEETQIIFSEDNGYKVSTMVGRDKTAKLELELHSENAISVTCFNSTAEKITYVKINSVAQVES